MSDAPLPKVPGFRLDEKLAQGGMGVVYAATDETLGRKVAIKMIRAELLKDAEAGSQGEESLARFLREARLAAQIKSNHVAHVLHFGQTDHEDLYLVLEFLAGKTLQDVLRNERHALDVPRVLKISRQICRGMQAAHDLGIVHRDLKPSNVMLVHQDGDPEFVKILDFGVAKLVGEAESGVTQAGSLVGTYTCMAPEQVMGETIDARTDVYALGVLIFRLLTGRTPFPGKDMAAVLYHHVHTAPKVPSALAPTAQIPSALDALVLACLEKEPDRRIASMRELDEKLAAISVENVPTTPGARLSQLPTAMLDTSDAPSAFDVDGPSSMDGNGPVFTQTGPGGVPSMSSGGVDTAAETALFDSSSASNAQAALDPPTPMTAAALPPQAMSSPVPTTTATGAPVPNQTMRWLGIGLAASVGLFVVAAVILSSLLLGDDPRPAAPPSTATAREDPANEPPASATTALENPAPSDVVADDSGAGDSAAGDSAAGDLAAGAAGMADPPPTGKTVAEPPPEKKRTAVKKRKKRASTTQKTTRKKQTTAQPAPKKAATKRPLPQAKADDKPAKKKARFIRVRTKE